MAAYKDFPKGDARRCFTVLVAVDELGADATLHYVAQSLSCTRAEAQRALQAAAVQFDVELTKVGYAYAIASWGVLNQEEVRKLLRKR
jgi:hypothetical protein